MAGRAVRSVAIAAGIFGSASLVAIAGWAFVGDGDVAAATPAERFFNIAEAGLVEDGRSVEELDEVFGETFADGFDCELFPFRLELAADNGDLGFHTALLVAHCPEHDANDIAGAYPTVSGLGALASAMTSAAAR